MSGNVPWRRADSLGSESPPLTDRRSVEYIHESSGIVFANRLASEAELGFEDICELKGLNDDVHAFEMVEALSNGWLTAEQADALSKARAHKRAQRLRGTLR